MRVKRVSAMQVDAGGGHILGRKSRCGPVQIKPGRIRPLAAVAVQVEFNGYAAGYSLVTQTDAGKADRDRVAPLNRKGKAIGSVGAGRNLESEIGRECLDVREDLVPS